MTGMNRPLYRSMKMSNMGRPACAPTARTLGARSPDDITPDLEGKVHPGTGGMSITPGDPLLLPPHRRPSHLAGGYGKDPAWEIREEQLGSDLLLRLDPREPGEHGFVEPSSVVLLDAYQQALCSTAPGWRCL